MADAVTVTATEFDLAWEDLGLGPTPTVLRLPSPGRTEGERRRIRHAARATPGGRAGPPDLLESLARSNGWSCAPGVSPPSGRSPPRDSGACSRRAGPTRCR